MWRSVLYLAAASALDVRPRAALPRRQLGGAVALATCVVGPRAARAFGIPGMDGKVGGLEVGGVELNPRAAGVRARGLARETRARRFKDIGDKRPKPEGVPADAAPIDVDALTALARRGGVVGVAFISANGDAAVATLRDGARRSVALSAVGGGDALSLTAKLRDYGVPYTYPFDLSKFADASKRTSLRAKNQNVLDAEARARDEAEKQRVFDARLADEARARAAETGTAAAAPLAPNE